MTRPQQLGIIAFGLLLGSVVAAGVWLAVIRPEQCTPNLEADAATRAISAHKIPCAVFTWDLAEPGLPKHTVRYNGLGMHDDPVTFERPPNTRRILVIGDSYAQALQVPMEQGFVDTLERNLSAAGGTRYEVINLSIDTLGTDRLLMLYAAVGHRFDADVVLLATYVGNDVQNNQIELAKLRNEGYQSRPFFKLDSGDNLRLYNWQKDPPPGDDPAPAWLRRAITQRPYTIGTPPTPEIISTDPYQLEYPVQLGLYLPEDDYWQEAWMLTDATVSQFADLVEQQGSRFGVVVIPDRRAVHAADYQQTIRRYPFLGEFDAAAPQERMVALAEGHGVPTLDLLPDLRRVEDLGERAYLPLDGHYNPIGHLVTANAVQAWLFESALLP